MQLSLLGMGWGSGETELSRKGTELYQWIVNERRTIKRNLNNYQVILLNSINKPLIYHCLLFLIMYHQHRIQWPGWGGARNMNSMGPPLAAIFFMTYFYRAWGAWPPRHPPGSATDQNGPLFPHHAYRALEIGTGLED